MSYRVLSAECPLTVNEIKDHLRILDDYEDDLLLDYAESARVDCVAESWRAISLMTMELTMDDWPAGVLKFPLPPLVSVDSVQYTDDQGATSTVDTSVYYVDTASEPGRMVLAAGESWPSVTLAPIAGVKVAFTAGYAVTPPEFKAAVRLTLGHYYNNRDNVVIGTSAIRIPDTARSICLKHRGWR